MIYNLSRLFLLFIIYSIIGWIVETTMNIIKRKKFTNRGFFLGPYCPIYGMGVLLILLLLNKYDKDPIALFVMCIIICSTLEYFTSFAMEILFKHRWWDYSDKKFNINGRICLEYIIPFGIGGTLVYYIINPFIVKMLSIPNEIVIISIAIFVFIIFTIDIVISLTVITKISLISKNIETDSTEKITKQVKETLKGKKLQKRVVKAFPNMRYVNKKLKKK